jgi:hypothetical protein
MPETLSQFGQTNGSASLSPVMNPCDFRQIMGSLLCQLASLLEIECGPVALLSSTSGKTTAESVALNLSNSLADFHLRLGRFGLNKICKEGRKTYARKIRTT